MIKGANKNPECLVRVCAYDAQGEVLDKDEKYGRYEPSLFFLEFMMRVRVEFPKAVRFTCDVAC